MMCQTAPCLGSSKFEGLDGQLNNWKCIIHLFKPLRDLLSFLYIFIFLIIEFFSAIILYFTTSKNFLAMKLQSWFCFLSSSHVFVHVKSTYLI